MAMLLLAYTFAAVFAASGCQGFLPSQHARFSALPSPRRMRQNGRAQVNVLFYQNSTAPDDIQRQTDLTLQRFHREAEKKKESDIECILTIHGNKYNMTAWANAHPGGASILQKFHDRDATTAFEKAHHSVQAYAMLKDFIIHDRATDGVIGDKAQPTDPGLTFHSPNRRFTRLRHKLFTKEDPIGVHKYLGVFCLLNFIGRYRQMLFGDPAAGLGTRGHPWFAIACLFPHALLSLSSLIFHTVPKERVVGKPMIWQEYRVHNIVFGMRSVLASFATAFAIKAGNTPTARAIAILFCGACILGANYGADKATEKLRVAEQESTTATMPYWEGCSLETQLRFKGFYAYCQFMATLACLAVGNPAWGLAVLLAIQMASLLMTLVRKGLLSARGYHYGYTLTLIAPWFVGLRSCLHTGTLEFPLVAIVGCLMFQLRKQGVNKYALWIPAIIARLLIGDQFIAYAAW